MNVQLIDTETCNLKSISNALKFLEVNFSVVSDPRNLLSATHIILPGVGAFDAVMKKLTSNGLSDALRDKISKKDSAILGICLGMQILGEYSDEGDTSFGLGAIPAKIKKLKAMPSNKVPHVGLNSVEYASDSQLFKGIPNNSDFYFVHSYYIEAGNQAQVAGRGHYGKDFAAALAEGSRFAVQFHPEKSHTHGLQLLQNFASWNGRW